MSENVQEAKLLLERSQAAQHDYFNALIGIVERLETKLKLSEERVKLLDAEIKRLMEGEEGSKILSFVIKPSDKKERKE